MKNIFFCFSLLYFFSGYNLQGQEVNLGKYMDKHALTWEQLPMQWNEGAFVGNGLLGMMVYVDSINNAVVFHLGRPDVTDHRKAPDRKTSMGVAGANRIFDYCRLDVGKMLLYPEGKIRSGTFRLDIYNGELTGNLSTDKGELSFCAYTPNDREVNIVEVSSSSFYSWKGAPGNARSPRVRAFPHLKEETGYIDNPDPIVSEKSNEGSWVQPLLAGGDYATYWKEVPEGKSRSVLYVSTANEVPASNVSLTKATATVESACATTHTALKKEMRNWWNNYHQHSFISIPDKKMENFYHIQTYKLGTCSHPEGPAMDLFGTFFKVSSWPSYWWNLNIQLTYMPVYPTNRLDQGNNYQKLIDEFLSPLVQTTDPSKMGDFAWALQNYYMYLRYSGTDWEEINRQFTPKALEILKAFEKILERKGDTYHLKQIQSPEYEGNKVYDNTHYGLASLHWLLETLVLCHDKAASVHPDYNYWKDILAHLHPYPINENGMMIAPGVPLAKSHRHYSHLLAFYPFRLLRPDEPANRDLLEKSIDHWISIENGKALAGYSYTGAASLYAYLGDGNKAYQQVDHFLNKPIGISLLLPNTFYVESKGKNVVIETPLSAATAMAEMLIQSWGDVIRVFPAVPDDWADCAFHDLRAEGAFVVSAQRKGGTTQWVSVRSEKGLPCRIYLPGWKEVHQISKGKTIPVQSLGKDIYQLNLAAGETVVLASAPSIEHKLELIHTSNETERNFYGVKSGQGLPYLMEWPEPLVPLTERVNVQGDTARSHQIIDNEWVAVGTNKPHSIQHDYTKPFKGKPSYRFELKQTDNTLEGYAQGETKGRAELSYCYATAAGFSKYPPETYSNAQKAKTVYHYGKGFCPQGSSNEYEFSIYIPSDLSRDVSTIFAQWHGMPDRRLVSTPEGEVKMLTMEEFLELYDRMIFKKNIAHDKVAKTDKKGNPIKDKEGNPVYQAGKANGWLIEQGGYPPLAFGFSGGWFYIKSNSDRKWLTDKTDRCNASPEKTEMMKPVTSKFKASTIAYKMPFEQFPKDCWITFRVRIDWTVYGGETEQIVKPGSLDVLMNYEVNGQMVNRKIVDNESILIGRNDEDGYYFKFGIYRVGNSTVPVCYNLAGYSEKTMEQVRD